jgi:ABC-2 type transport system ATP-binding protein
MQRLAMAQAIVARPKLLILDEPFSGLDPIGRQEFRELFFALKQEGTTLFLCSHILSDIEFLCEKAAIVAKGTLRGIVDLATRRKDSQRQVEVVLDRLGGEMFLSKLPDGAKIRREGDSIVVICDQHESAAPFLKEVINSKIMVLEQYRPAQLNLTQLFRDLVQDEIDLAQGGHNG